jgi:hypothetical protein
MVKHCTLTMIVMYACNYISGWTYDVMFPLEATFINGMNADRRIEKFEELCAMYNSVITTRNNWEKIAEVRRKPVIQLRSVADCEKMFMKCVQLPSFDIYPRRDTTLQERKFFDDVVTVYGNIIHRQDTTRRVNKRLQEPHKQYVTSHDPMGNSEELSLHESMWTVLQSMQTAIQAKIVESLKTFEYEVRTYDMEHILNRLLENVEEEIKRLLENVEEETVSQRPTSRKRPHHDSVGGAVGVGATSTSISKLL